MAYSKEVLHRAEARLEQARRQNELDCERRISAIYEKLPRLAEIDRELRKTSAKVYAAAFRESESPEQAMQKLKEENLSLQRERDWILESENIDPEDLEREPVCRLCSGSGWRGAVMCECLQELCRQEQKKVLLQSFGAGKESFEKFRLDVYPDRLDPKLGISPRALMKRVYESAVSYARTFSTASESLLFMGATGLGKTLLSGCIARAVADRGYSVCYVSAGKLFSDFETEKFRLKEDGALTGEYMETDLLIIDDLGTELPNSFTVSQFFLCINERILRKKSTLISSNLDMEALRSIYSERTLSRIISSYTIRQLPGSDIRIKKKLYHHS